MKLWKCMRCKGFFWRSFEAGQDPFIRERRCKDCGGVLMPHKDQNENIEQEQTERTEKGKKMNGENMKDEIWSAEPKTLLADMELVHRQLHCVKHLCEAVAELADAKIKMLPRTATGGDLGHHLIKMDGNWTNSFMQWVGDLLNGLDAVDAEEDERWQKTFQEASERWKNLTEELNAKA